MIGGICRMFLVTAFSVTIEIIESQQDGPERLLYNNLMKNYRKSVRPTYDHEKPIKVDTAFALKAVHRLDEKHQYLEAFGWVGMTWKDEYLAWNSTEYNGLKRLVIPGGDIWLPEVAILNAVDDGTDLSVSADCRVSVTSDGVVFWPPGFQLRTTCRVNMRHFPFDVQTCFINLTNFAHSMGALTYTASASKILLGAYQDNGEWELADTAAVTSVTVSSRGTRKFPVIGFKLVLRRRPLYYVINIVLPSTLLTLVSCLVFLLHPSSGEKVSLSISVLLSFSLFLVLVSDIMPRTSDNLPYLGISVIFNMSLTSLSLVATVAVINVYHKDPKHPVPVWMRAVFLRWFARLLCMEGYTNKVEGTTNADDKIQPIRNDGNAETTNKNANDRVARMVWSTDRHDDKNIADELKKTEWQRVAMVIDRTCLVIFFLVSLASTLTFAMLMAI